MGADRRHCHTTALETGSPVYRSQTSVVSRWFVIPIASICFGETPVAPISSSTTCRHESSISRGECSTHPGDGYIWAISRLTLPRTRPDSSRRRAVVPVVP